MNNPTLTIIVPCWNVETYLRKCVNSILNQTYRELDILLIDDGSTDETPAICDELAAMDDRIRVMHQANKGSSLTRNIGVKNTSSDYVTFVDADDWIHPEMYKNMMLAMLKENVDIAQCGVCDYYIDNKEKHRYQDFYNGAYEKYNHLDGFFKLIEETEWRSYFWNKIYKKELFRGVAFPTGRGLDEDTSVMHQLFHNAHSSIYFNDEYYFYYHRPQSISQARSLRNVTKNYYDRANARLERYYFVAEHPEYEKIMPFVKSITISMCVAALRYVAKYPKYFPENYFDKLSSQIISIPIKQKEMDRQWISRLKKIELRYLKFSPFLYKSTIGFIHK